MVRYATTFSEYADILARNAPHALILGEWRRLDRAIDEYYARRGKERPSKPSQIEADVARDPLLGLEASCQLRGLRVERNRVTHEAVGSVSYEEATFYARHAMRLTWTLAGAGSFTDIELPRT